MSLRRAGHGEDTMQWEDFLATLSRMDRIRLLRWLDEGAQYANLAARGTKGADREEILGFIDRALDALAAARILLGVPAEPRPWADSTYRAYRSYHPTTAVRVRPAELAALQRAAAQRASQQPGMPHSQAAAEG